MKLGTLGLVIGFAVLAAWFVALRPTALGGPVSYIFVTGSSMLPTLETGDLVLLREEPRYEIGEVVAFRVPDGPGAGRLVIHRIVGGSAAEGFVMQGDNKAQPDEWRPMLTDIEGTLWVRAPGAGNVVAALRSPTILAPLAAGLTVTFILLGGTRPRPIPTPEREP